MALPKGLVQAKPETVENMTQVTNRKSDTGFRLVTFLMMLNDVERP